MRSGEPGFVADNDEGFIRAVLRLMQDSELHQRMKHAAREHACSISWDRVFEKVYENYEAVLFPAPILAAS